MRINFIVRLFAVKGKKRSKNMAFVRYLSNMLKKISVILNVCIGHFGNNNRTVWYDHFDCAVGLLGFVS